MSFDDYRIEAEQKIVQNGIVLVSSFWRDHLMYYIGLRDAGLTHPQAGRKLLEKYGRGGGPHPHVHSEDEIGLMR